MPPPRLVRRTKCCTTASTDAVSPLRVMPEPEALSLRRQVEAAEAEHDRPLPLIFARTPTTLLRCIDRLVRNEVLLDAVESIIGPDILIWPAPSSSKAERERAIREAGIRMRATGASSRTTASPPGSHSPAAGRRTVPCDSFRGVTSPACTSTTTPCSRQHSHPRSAGARCRRLPMRLTWPLEPGEISLHHMRVVHGSRPNRSADRRMGLAVNYIPPHVRQTTGPDCATLLRGVDRFRPLRAGTFAGLRTWSRTRSRSTSRHRKATRHPVSGLLPASRKRLSLASVAVSFEHAASIERSRMEYRMLGRTGVRVSCLCLGTDNFADPTRKRRRPASSIGPWTPESTSLIPGDTYADGEGEKIIGRALARRGRRDQVSDCDKVDHGRRRPGYSIDDPGLAGPNDHGHSRLNIIRACENSLRRLRTEYIDLYQVHRHSPDIPIDETLGALTDLVRPRQGPLYRRAPPIPLGRSWEALMVSERHGLARYISEQPPYNLLDRRIETSSSDVPASWPGNHHLGADGDGSAGGPLQERTRTPRDSRAALPRRILCRPSDPARNRHGAALCPALRQAGLSPRSSPCCGFKDQPGIAAPLIGPRTVAHLEELLPVSEARLDPSLRAACDALVPPGSAAANFHNTADWMKMRIEWSGEARTAPAATEK